MRKQLFFIEILTILINVGLSGSNETRISSIYNTAEYVSKLFNIRLSRLDNFYISAFASMPMIPMGKDRLLPILALILLFIASSSSLYVYASQTTSGTVQVNGQQYTMDQLFLLAKPRMFNDSQYSGIALDDLILKTGVPNPEQHTFTLKGSDGYEKTVTWENMRNGLLTKDHESIFSDLPNAFRVKDIVTIEVK